MTQREFAGVADRGWGESTTQIVPEPLLNIDTTGFENISIS